MEQQPLSILLVEDDESSCEALCSLLAMQFPHARITCAADGRAGLERFRRELPEIVITDINMPEMNGITFLKELNRTYPRSNVIMITAYGGVESYIEAMNLGAFEYINKPVKIEELKSILKKIFKETSH